jgi:hypothetical protein
LRSIVSLLAFAAAGCGAYEGVTHSADTWVGTITTEGDVTTVVNESGSIWGGVAALVEEASIGVDAGDDPYMFGSVTGVWATADEIYVVDADVPAVRVYGWDGTWRRDIGREGQGPGEFLRPDRVATLEDGTVLVTERPPKITLYTPEGEYLDTWSWTARVFRANQRLVVVDGVPFVDSIEQEGESAADRRTRYGMQAAGPEGKVGGLREFRRLDVPSRTGLTYRDGRLYTPVPFMPYTVDAMLPSGQVVYGDSEQYRFTLEDASGARTVVERRVDLIPVLPEEREAYERFTTAEIHSRDPGWTWNGSPIPPTKPAFHAFYPAVDGRLLVQRKGEGVRLEPPGCNDDPKPDDFTGALGSGDQPGVCWRDRHIWDVFGGDGRYLGELDVPDLPVVADPFLDGDMLLLAIEDEAGTIVVKRYRLVLPGEEGSGSRWS